MVHLKIDTHIQAPIDQVFNLARSVDVHLLSAAHTGETVIAGKTTGYFELGDEVTWQAKHLGIRQRLSAKIIRMHPPHAFTDVMTQGAFASLEHLHFFETQANESTLMRDELIFTTPFGPLGRLAEILILKAHMTRFLKKRNQILKQIAESQQHAGYDISELSQNYPETCLTS